MVLSLIGWTLSDVLECCQDAQHGEVGRYCPVLGWICRLDLLFDVREMSQFEAEPARLKPLLGRAFSSFTGRKSVQHGTVEHYCAMLEGEITCDAYAY